MQMQGSEAVWQLVLDVHLHCVYPGPNEIGYDMFGYNVPILPQLVKRRATLSPLWSPAHTSPVPATIRPAHPPPSHPPPPTGGGWVPKPADRVFERDAGVPPTS